MRVSDFCIHALFAVWFVSCISGCLERELEPLTPCLVSGVRRTVSVDNIDKIDLLFMVDNSSSMRDEQEALRMQFPKLIRTLTSGRRSADDPNPFPPVKDLHLGVVSSDLGTPGISGNPFCSPDGGDNGRLQHAGHGSGCSAQYPTFLTFDAAAGDDPDRLAHDFGCIAMLGTQGCGFEQQLEAPLKALWPSTYVDASGNVVSDNPIRFLSTSQQGTYGLGDVPLSQGGNLGFLRNDSPTGPSLLAIVVVTDEEDCSSRITDHLQPADRLDASSPYYGQDINLRCHYNPQNLFEVKQRYLMGFRALRPGREDLVVFAAIAGVPVDLVDAQARDGVDFGDPVQRAAYYDRLLSDTRMQEVIDPTTDPGHGGGNLVPSCRRPASEPGGEEQKAYPPRRIVQLAKAFGQNAVVQSICQDDFGPAMDAVIELIVSRLALVCLPRPLVRKADDKVSCDVVWELPAPGTSAAATPTDCSAAPYLSPIDDPSRARNDRGGINCTVHQVPVSGRSLASTDEQGWYYDDFSNDVRLCRRDRPQRVAFTPGAKPPSGAVVRLECLTETQHVSNARTDLSQAVAQPEIGTACGPETPAGQPEQTCVQTRADGTTDESMFCHPQWNVCVQSCTSQTECPPAWVCDRRADTLAISGGRGVCVNPTCSGR